MRDEDKISKWERRANVEISIRRYQEIDRKDFIRLMEELQDYLVSIDDLKRLRRMPEYGESYTERTFQNVAKNNGVIYLAESEGRVVGLVVGIIHEQTREELLELIPYKRGVVLELIVENEYREKGIGKLLMEKMESYFKQNGCSAAMVEVFFPNKNALRLYSKLGYSERDVWMTKNL
jgi:ribosomal protein S18 acetylase RimI-like enzyme